MKLRRILALMLIASMLAALPSLTMAEETDTLLLPESLQTIKEEAFMGTTNLNKVIVSDGTLAIESRAFAGSSVKEIVLPGSITSIADDAFADCTDLTIAANSGSYAYDWATEKGYTIIPIPATGDVFTGPVVTEAAWSGDMIQADIAVYKRSNQGDADDIWWWDFCREYFKIDFNVIQTTSASDYKSIAFMGGNMPDVFYQMFISSNQQTEMGDLNGFLLNLEPYMTSGLMPNLSRIFKALPNAKASLSTQSGAIYALGAFNNPNQSNMTFYINQRWLNEAGLSLPSTLDEFETVLAAFKARGEGVVPMAGDYGNAPRYLANAMGWVTNSASYLTSPALRKGSDGQYHAEFIFGNEELFPEFMKIMKKWIDAGYFSSNLFSSQDAGEESNALKAADKTGFEQNYSNTLDSSEWVAAKFLTSQWNSSSQVGRTYNAINNQSFSLASDVDSGKIQRLIKWLDWHYDYDNYQLSHSGPSASDTDWLLGLESGWTAVKENGRWTWTCAELAEYDTFGNYQNQRVQGIIGGYVGLAYDMFGDAQWPVNPNNYSHKEPENVLPYIVDPYPQITFLSMTDLEKTSELSWQINSYVNEQYASFLMGVQEINAANLEVFYAELTRLGFEEYEKIYADYYEKAFND